LIDRAVGFAFIRPQCRSFYSHTGRPSVDPVVLFKMLLIGYLYGITSERRLARAQPESGLSLVSGLRLRPADARPQCPPQGPRSLRSRDFFRRSIDNSFSLTNAGSGAMIAAP
jgi:hypothetical protein